MPDTAISTSTTAELIATHDATRSSESFAALLHLATERPTGDSEGDTARAYLRRSRGFSFRRRASGFTAHRSVGMPKTETAAAETTDSAPCISAADIAAFVAAHPAEHLLHLAWVGLDSLQKAAPEDRERVIRVAAELAAAAVSRYLTTHPAVPKTVN